MLRPGSNLRVTVTIGNGGSTAISGADASLRLSSSRVDAASDLGDWLQGTSTDEQLGREVGRLTDLTVAPRTTTDVVFDVPAADLGFTAQVTGAYPLTVVLTDADGQLAEARTAVVWQPNDQTPTVGLGLVMPIVVPREPTGIIDSETLQGYTEPAGLLSRELNAALSPSFPMAIAVDPMILASIRLLGSDAPQSAIDWMSRLESAPNDKFTLSYADSDLTAGVQAGAGAVLAPQSLDFALDEARFDAPTDEATQSPEPTAPTDEPGAVVLPTTEELLALPNSVGGIGWPAADSVVTDDLPALTAAGYSSLILSSGNVASEGTSASRDRVRPRTYWFLRPCCPPCSMRP